jgi:glyoxylase-like metal-dependent hydrolase (beta-lactamase superfamily II)
MPRIDWNALDRWFDQPTADALSAENLAEMGAPPAIVEKSLRGIGAMRLSCPPFKPDHLVDDGDTISLSGVEFSVICTPGHSPGHCCLYQEEKKMAILGDHILPEITPHIAVDSLELLPDPLTAYRKSLERFRSIAVEENWPSHGPQILDLNRRIDELLLHHTQREDKLVTLLTDSAAPLTCYEVSQSLFDLKQLDDFAGWLAASETLAHLRSLVNDGRAFEEEECGVFRYRVERTST